MREAKGVKDREENGRKSKRGIQCGKKINPRGRELHEESLFVIP